MNTEARLMQWMQITATYCTDEKSRRHIFAGLISNYTSPNRYYHTLNHIESMLTDLENNCTGSIDDVLFFAVWFHDAIYNTTTGNNEAKSAELAAKQLQQLQVPGHIINEVESLILKTANHIDATAENEKTRLFLDMDLKILGAAERDYTAYTKAVRKEYAVYPSLMFNAGRKKFIAKTLTCPRIYKTEKFFTAYEQQARKNLLTELNQLL